MFYLALFSLVIALVASGLWFLSRWHEDRTRAECAKRNIKYVPQRNALVQAIFKERVEKARDELIKKEGAVFGFQFLGSYTICVAEPELAQMVFTKDFTNFINRRRFDIDDQFFKNNISVMRDEEWKRMRAVMTPTFTIGKLRRMKPFIDDTIRTLLKNFAAEARKHPNGHVNMKQTVGAFTMDTIIQVAFGVKVDSLVDKDNPVIAQAKRLNSTDMSWSNIAKFTLFFMAPKLAKLLKIRIFGEVMDYFTAFATPIIERQRKTILESKNFKAQSYIELLLEAEIEEEEERARDSQSNGAERTNGHCLKPIDSNHQNVIAPKKKYITHEELIAQTILFFIAGYDTTASAIIMAFYSLCMNPETQEKLYEEIVTVTAKLEEDATEPKDPVELVTLESLSKFEYLNGVVNETLRIYSPALFTERAASKDMTLATEDGRIRIHLKEGDILHFPIYSMHRNQQDFPEPERFMPERFVGEPQFRKASYMPFGSGPRNCVARSLALLEVKLALLHGVREYKFSLCPETNLQFFYQSQSMIPKDIILKIEKR